MTVDICTYNKQTDELLSILHKQFKKARSIYKGGSTEILQPVISITSAVLACEFYDKSPDDEDGAIVDLCNERVALFGADDRREGLRQLIAGEVSRRIADV